MLFRFAKMTGLAAAALMALGMPAANASIVYNTSLDSPGTIFGKGNPNTNWTVDNEANGVQLGLQGLDRYVGPYDPGSSNIYYAATGQSTHASHGGSVWDIAFSVNSGTTALADTVASLCMTDNATGSYGCVNPLTFFPDNTVSGNVAQNSEMLAYYGATPNAFALAIGDSKYDVYANDTYRFTLSLSNMAGDQLLGQVSATVVAGDGAAYVPEPPTLALFGAALFGLGIFAFRRRHLMKA